VEKTKHDQNDQQAGGNTRFFKHILTTLRNVEFDMALQRVLARQTINIFAAPIHPTRSRKHERSGSVIGCGSKKAIAGWWSSDLRQLTGRPLVNGGINGYLSLRKRLAGFELLVNRP
jgi:hypothetical protein